MLYYSYSNVAQNDQKQSAFLYIFITQVINLKLDNGLSTRVAYHFIKMLNRPIDLPLRFIVVCVAEPLTFNEEMAISIKLDTMAMS